VTARLAPQSWKNDNSKAAIVQASVREILGAVRRPVSTAEVDLLSAMETAAREMRADGNAEGTLFVIDSGLSTAGRLDMARLPILSTANDKVIRQLAGEQDLPNLAGFTVIFQGLGDVAAPQDRLPTPMRRALVALWATIANESGAACTVVDDSVLGKPAVAGAPPVSRVPVPAQRPLDLDQPIVFTNDEIQFVAGQATFLDRAAASATLASLADLLKQTSTLVVITGTTANDGSEQYRLNLSMARAEAVRLVLVERGVDPGRIRTRGVGCRFGAYLTDKDANGHLIDAVAQQNRTVVVTAEGPKSDAILQGGGCSP
jgi:outer membrane protein OmpA-like peptidoglycan-associated protein